MRHKHKAFRGRDGRETGEKLEKSQQQRKNGEALSVEMQTKRLPLLLSNASKIPHLYLVSILLATFQVNPQRNRRDR